MARPADPKPKLKTVHSNGKRYEYWTVRIRGRDVRLGRDRRKAFVKFHRLMADDLGRDASPGRPTTIAGAAEVWLLSHKAAKNVPELRPFIKFAGAMHLDEVTPDMLHNYHDHLRRATYRRPKKDGTLGKLRRYATSSIRDHVVRAQSVLRLAAGRGWCSMPDVPKPAKPHFVDRSAEPVSLWSKLDAMPERAGRIFKFMAATGCRPGEAVSLKWEHVHFDHGLCVLPDHKTADRTGKPRVIALTDEAVEALRSVPGTGEGCVFLSRFNQPYSVSGLRSIAVKHLGCTTYDLRHSFAQNAIDAGEAPATVSKLLGHKSSGMVWQYAEIKDRQLVEAARNLKVRRTA